MFGVFRPSYKCLPLFACMNANLEPLPLELVVLMCEMLMLSDQVLGIKFFIELLLMKSVSIYMVTYFQIGFLKITR